MLDDMKFAIKFAQHAGKRMREMRLGVRVKLKLDRTEVTNADTAINQEFIEAVSRRSRGKDSVRGEEASRQAGQERVWVIDPIDGTGEYTDPKVPSGRRTSCVGIALFVRGGLKLAVVYNPFRDELFTVGADGPAQLNGRPLGRIGMPCKPGAPYDYCHWDGAAFDLRGLERPLGKPLGVYSAIYQVCMVAASRSSFAAFPGNTIHDIAPGALMVARLGGIVTDFSGRPLRWNDLRYGVLYATPNSHAQALRLIRAL
jgi:myo-inositol-1(or 4)-monophosphatase